MTAQLLDGEAAAAAIKGALAARVAALADRGVTPGLGTILVGDDGPSARYVSMKHADAAALGIGTVDLRLPADATQADVEGAVDQLNADPAVDAFIVQYPLPAGLDFGAVMERVLPAKDADGMHPHNLGRLVMGEPAPLACTPAGIVELLALSGIEMAGKHVVVVGRGLTIGRPLVNLLTLKKVATPSALGGVLTTNAAVTVVHTGVDDVGAYTAEADIVIAAAGAAGFLRGDMIRPGAVVVAAGVSFIDGKVVSDAADDVAEVAGWLTPRVGGVGPMTRAMLLANAVAAAERSVGGAA